MGVFLLIFWLWKALLIFYGNNVRKSNYSMTKMYFCNALSISHVISSKLKSCHAAKFVVTGHRPGCHNDNLNTVMTNKVGFLTTLGYQGYQYQLSYCPLVREYYLSYQYSETCL